MYTIKELIKVSPREADILRELFSYDRNEDVANALCISVHTVKSHVRNLLRLFEVGSRHRLIVRAIQWGFVTPDGEWING